MLNVSVVFGAIAGPIVRVFRIIWQALRVKDGTLVSIGMFGDHAEVRPQVLILGLDPPDPVCLMRLPLMIKNYGRVATRNLAVRVRLPKALIANLPVIQTNLKSTESFYSVDLDTINVQLNYELQTLRIDETAVIEIMLRAGTDDWVTVKAGGQRKHVGDYSFFEIGTQTPIRLIALPISVSVHADNIRAVTRKWDILVTPTNDLSELEQQSTSLITVQLIWKIGMKVFLFPFFGSLVWIPWFRRRCKPVALTHIRSDSFAVKPEFAYYFDLAQKNKFVSAWYSQYLLANPGCNKTKFIKWLKEVYTARPAYYR